MSSTLQAEIENLTREILKVVLPNPDAGTDYSTEHGDRLYADAMICAVTALLDTIQIGPISDNQDRSQRVQKHADLVYAAAARYKAAVLLSAAADDCVSAPDLGVSAVQKLQEAKKLLGKD